MNKSKDKNKILTVLGTRPEAIKLAPLIKGFQQNDSFNHSFCRVHQHGKEVDKVLEVFEIESDFDVSFDLSDRGVFADVNKISKLFRAGKSGLGLLNFFQILKKDWDLVIVHGDTSTAFLGAFLGFHMKIPVAHIEAGLRTNDRYSPFPEEMNRRLVGDLANLHFAPTETAKQNLLREGIEEEQIEVVGNTVLDAVRIISEKLKNQEDFEHNFRDKYNLPEDKKLILVTAHRRENFGEGLENICDALLDISQKRDDIHMIYPVHPNPSVREVVFEKLQNKEGISLVEPLSYKPFIFLIKNSHLILTDSGGIQEEASFLGTPILVLREDTEREEAIEAGNSKLVGTDQQKIIFSTENILDNSKVHKKMSEPTKVFGDGHSSDKIIERVEDYFGN